ncbi:hypothetical protein Pcinc_007548 [Petrolisthes cinctipes]|uniref:Uncharacterized protein n=1 Tax=Petrolisthes cinctipes TaxID=88211 RepID=A0AAE1G989_PETCI|nr:hypothetical protein Pcinc_007548 [Petrolisthes cinctipes]
MNPFTSMRDDEFVDRFRLRKVSAVTLLEEVRNELPAAADLRGCPVPPHLQLLISIRCMATGSHQGPNEGEEEEEFNVTGRTLFQKRTLREVRSQCGEGGV